MRHLLILIGIVFCMSLSSCATRVVVRPHTPKVQTVKVVKVAPAHHKIVVIKGKRYYYWNGRHYKKTTKGFVFVKV